MSEEKRNQIIAVFQKHGGIVKQNALCKGTKYENELEIIQQPTGLSAGFGGFCHIVETRTNYTNDEKQVFQVSMVGTWLSLSGAIEYQKQLLIAISLLRDLSAIDPTLIGGLEFIVKEGSEKK